METRVSKTIFLFILLFEFSETIRSQSLDMNGMPHEANHEVSYSFKSRTTLSQFTWDSIRPISEINQADPIGEGYPYVSSDGLRLYFSQGTGNSVMNLYVSSRNNTGGPFGAKQLLSSNFPNGCFSGWLTNDELEIFYIYSSTMYYSSRTSSLSSFNTPTVVTLNGMGSNFFAGPSLTLNKQELYLWSVNGTISKLIKTGTLDYSFSGNLTFPAGCLAGPGQLSKDDLTYYLSLDSNGVIKIYELTRPTTSS